LIEKVILALLAGLLPGLLVWLGWKTKDRRQEAPEANKPTVAVTVTGNNNTTHVGDKNNVAPAPDAARAPQPAPQEEVVALSFSAPEHEMEAGSASKLRLLVCHPRKRARLDGPVLVRFEAPSNLRVPHQIVEQGQFEIDVPITADIKTGRFEVRIAVEGARNTAPLAACTVTVVEPRRAQPDQPPVQPKPPPVQPEPPPDVAVRFVAPTVQVEAGQAGKLRIAVDRRGRALQRDAVALTFEAPSDLKLPAFLLLERGQVELDVPVTAGQTTGKFEVKVVPRVLGSEHPSFDTCLVTVIEPARGPDNRARAAEPPPKRPPERASLYLRCPRQLTWQVPDGQTEELAAFCRRHHIRVLAWGPSYKDGPGAPVFVPVRLAPPAEWQEVQVENGRTEQTIRRLRDMRIEVAPEKPATLG
jgi:hypothetical protein